jgi:hypothetical protein
MDEVKNWAYTVQPGPPTANGGGRVLRALSQRKRLSAQSPAGSYVLRRVSAGTFGRVPSGAKETLIKSSLSTASIDKVVPA